MTQQFQENCVGNVYRSDHFIPQGLRYTLR